MTPSSSPLDLLLRKLETHSRLNEEDREAVRALPVTLKALAPHSYVTREGDMPRAYAVLLSGMAYRQKLTADGARQIVGLYLPGEPLGFENLFLAVADHSVQMLTAAELAFVPHAQLQELMLTRPAVGRALQVAMLVEASIAREWILNVGRRGAVSRLSHLLCEFALRLDAQGLSGADGYELPMTQEQLGDALGLTAVHVNRTIKSLESRGLIEREGRRIRFPDWDGICEVADFNARYLHLARQRSGLSAKSRRIAASAPWARSAA